MADNKNEQTEIVLIGFVYEIENHGHFKGIAISTGEDDYLVELDEMGQRLLKEIENDVKVTGFVAKGLNGTNRLTVTDFEVLNQEDYDRDNYKSEDLF
jgi:hypothetical protein